VRGGLVADLRDVANKQSADSRPRLARWLSVGGCERIQYKSTGPKYYGPEVMAERLRGLGAQNVDGQRGIFGPKVVNNMALVYEYNTLPRGRERHVHAEEAGPCRWIEMNPIYSPNGNIIGPTMDSSPVVNDDRERVRGVYGSER